jgi:hypothetical protein
MNPEKNPSVSPPSPPTPSPQYVTPWVRTAQPDGSFILKPGRPVLEEEEISSRAAAQLLGLSQRRVNRMCEHGILVEGRDWWRPPGRNRGGRYHLKRAAVLNLKQSANLKPVREF